MKVQLTDFDGIVATELAKRRKRTIGDLLSDLLRFEACVELVQPEQPTEKFRVSEARELNAQIPLRTGAA